MGLDRLHDERRKAVLYGPKDSNPPRERIAGPPSAPSEFVILIHPAYHWGGDAVHFPAGKLPSARPLPGVEDLGQPDLQQAFKPQQAGIRDYEDPVRIPHPDYQGRWLAGFAPVGNTELVVIVQQRYDEAITPDYGVWWTGSALTIGTIILAGFAWSAVHRAVQRRSQQPQDLIGSR
jgi:hypothetical protein